jgi:hypothetical protein
MVDGTLRISWCLANFDILAHLSNHLWQGIYHARFGLSRVSRLLAAARFVMSASFPVILQAVRDATDG